MVSPASRPAAAPEPAEQPAKRFFYGLRYVSREREDGRVVSEAVPLTRADILHPREGDIVIESLPHERRRRYLANVLEAVLADDPTAVVLSDVLIAWPSPGPASHAPDITVFLGVRERKKWSSFDMTAEGVLPALIIEVTSPATVENDRSSKLEEYEQGGLGQYVIVDGMRGDHHVPPRLYGYQLGPHGFQGQAADERGRLWLEAPRLWLGVEDDEIVCYDEADRPLGDYVAVTAELARAEQQVREAEQRAAAEAEQRAALEARLREAEAALRQLRGEQ